MRLARGTALSLFTLALMTTAATAETRCSSGPADICDGCTATVHWKVTQAVPNGEHNRCSIAWSSVGGHMQFQLLTTPRLGKASFEDYSVYYKGERLGHDQMVVKMHWVSTSGRAMSGTVTYDINVVVSQ